MSTYIRETKNPRTGKWEEATWHDDLFGSHIYGVIFPSDAEEIGLKDWEGDEGWSEQAKRIAYNADKEALTTRDPLPKPEEKVQTVGYMYSDTPSDQKTVSTEPPQDWKGIEAEFMKAFRGYNFNAPTRLSLIDFISALKGRAYSEGQEAGRLGVITKVEETIAEFGDQGIECVAGILQEWFHGGKEVQY